MPVPSEADINKKRKEYESNLKKLDEEGRIKEKLASTSAPLNISSQIAHLYSHFVLVFGFMSGTIASCSIASFVGLFIHSFRIAEII